MAIGPIDDSQGGGGAAVGLFENIVTTFLGIIGGVLASLRAASVPIARSIEARVNHTSPNVLLDPASVAVAVVKGVIDQGTGMSESQYGGLDPSRFDVLVKATGNAPSWGDLLDQWRRGLISEDVLEHGIRTGLLRNEWIGFVKALKFVPLSAAQYLGAAVRGHIDHGEAIAKAGTLGLNPTDAELLYQSMGSPPGVQQSLELWNRGYIDEATMDQIVAESDYKPKYLAAIKSLAHYLPPPRTTTALLRNGSISMEVAQRLFEQYGLSPELAAAYVRDASHGRAATHKQASVGVVKSLFVDHLITREQALEWLVRIGYEEADSNLLLDLASYEAKQRLRTKAIGKIETLFVSKHIDEVTARADLAHLGVEIDQIASLIDIWGLEQTTPSKILTLGQLNQALKKSLITDEDFIQRVINLGYTLVDAQLLHDIDIPPTTA